MHSFKPSERLLEKSKIFSDLLVRQKALFKDLIGRKAGRGLIRWYLMVWRIILAKSPSKSSVKVTKHFSREVWKIYQGGGSPFLIKYLKGCSVLLQQSAGGHRIHSAHDLGCAISRTRAGLPRIIPAQQRLEIRKGNPKVIQWWLSVFNTYRVIPCKGKANLDTITKGSGLSLDYSILYDSRVMIRRFYALLINLGAKLPRLLIHKDSLVFKTDELTGFLSEKSTSSLEGGMSGESKGSSYLSIFLSVMAWRELASRLLVLVTPSYLNMDKVTDKDVQDLNWQRELVLSFAHWVTNVTPWAAKFFDSGKELATITTALYPRGFKVWGTRVEAKSMGNMAIELLRVLGLYYSIGRLVGLEEAAGKVRIIAMVDIFTQYVLRPLHDFIFSNILKYIPQDGTFNQEKPLLLLQNRMRAGNTSVCWDGGKGNPKWIASYDLSAATDCLPVKLQVALLEPILGSDLSRSWRSLLVARPYSFQKKQYFYGVGQPMGAYSSWAMLALSHHFIVQWAAFHNSRKIRWFPSYAVLGDDIVIADEHVADEYLTLLKRLGVKVGLAKSVVSPKGFHEFAKRYMSLQANMSPVSLRELLVGKVNFPVLLELTQKWGGSIATLVSLMGYRHNGLGQLHAHYTKLPKKIRTAILSFSGPGSLGFDWDKWLRSRSAVLSTKNLNHDAIPMYIDDIAEVLLRRLTTFRKNITPGLNMWMWGGADDKQVQDTRRLTNDDPRLMKQIRENIYLPIINRMKGEAGDLRSEIVSLRKEVLKQWGSSDINVWIPFLESISKLREKTFLIPINPYDQKPSPVVHRPDARAFVRLYNRLSVVSRLTVPAELQERIDAAKAPKAKRKFARKFVVVSEEVL